MDPFKAHRVIKNHMLYSHLPLTYDLEKSEGVFLRDSKTDKYYLDCFTFYASNPLGHNHPGLNDPEFEKKLLQAAKIKPSNCDVVTEPFAEFVEEFTRVLPPALKNLFFIDGGTLAVDNAIKAAIDWKINWLLDRDLKADPREMKVIHFENSFHGRSGYSLSLTNTGASKVRLFPKEEWPRFKAPVFLGEQSSKNLTEDQLLFFKDLKNYLAYHENEVAALIIEPIQGEGGDTHFTDTFHQELRNLSNQFNFLLIHDEIQTGVGLTGKMWAHEHYEVVPDILCFGKKMQVCGFACSDRIHEVSRNVFNEKSRISSTWSGNLVDMVRSTQILKIIEKDDLIRNADEVGTYLLSRLVGLSAQHSSVILDDTLNVRGKGLMCAVTFKDAVLRDLAIDLCYQNNLLILPCGKKSIRFRPPLIFSKADVDNAVDILGEVCENLE